MRRLDNKQKWGLAIGGLSLTLLLAAVFTFGSLTVPFEPKSWRAVMVLYAVSSFITAALLVFGLILARTTLRLWVERRREQLGARFKTKMVVGAMAISLLPIVFMFLVSYSLINRSLLLWFPKPLEVASDKAQELLLDLGRTQLPRLRWLAKQAQAEANRPGVDSLQDTFAKGADALWILDAKGNVMRGGTVCNQQPEERTGKVCVNEDTSGKYLWTLQSGVEVWGASGKNYFAARVPATKPNTGSVVAAYRTSPGVLERLAAIQAQTHQYYAEKQDLRALKRQMLLILLLFTILLLSAVMWVALFLAKQVTIPIQALAEGTREVSSGNFDYQVPEQAQDELGVLVRSFNTMTTQLRDSRSQIDQFTSNLQLAVQELERRRQLMETVLENIPTAVISLDSSGVLLRENTAVARMFPANGNESDKRSLESLLGADATRIVHYLMRRSLRMGVVSREIEVLAAGRLLHLAVTVSSLGPRRANIGYVLVLDDLTEVLRAQKSAAWQEVARRIAHEIKNPLTPIQLSAQRLLHQIELRDESPQPAKDPELVRIAQECSSLIVREVSTLSSLVNEFSQFVRFPTAKLQPTDPNTAVQEALQLFSGRLEGITLKASLERNLPAIRADGQLLRSVIVNLIDNAAEALEGEPLREIGLATHLRPESDTIEISVSDTGKGISPEDKDKLFLPHFSTKDRGTGLGLAISARIISEHGGSLRMEDNLPRGSRFLIELPAAEQPATASPERAGVDTER
jgi:two-component system nitrogen regulation sensor histidine kinase NtrY